MSSNLTKPYYILKRDYPITFFALSQNAKRKGHYALASHFLLVYKHQLGPGILPALADYSKEVLALAGLPSQDASAGSDIDLKALRKRLKAEPSAALYFEYATALASNATKEREMIRYLQKAHDLEPANVAILTALAKTVPDQKKDHELLPELMEGYRLHPQQPDPLFQAIRLASPEKKGDLTRRLLTEHPDFPAGYQLLDLLAPEEVNPLLAEIPWLAQGTPTRTLVYTYLANRQDPAATFDLFRELYRLHPDELAVLEHLVRYSTQNPRPEHALWQQTYRTMVYRQVKERMAETEVYMVQDILTSTNDLLDDKNLKVLLYFLRDMNGYPFKTGEMSALVEAFPQNVYLNERLGDCLEEHDNPRAIRQYKHVLEMDEGRLGVYEKIEWIKLARKPSGFFGPGHNDPGHYNPAPNDPIGGRTLIFKDKLPWEHFSDINAIKRVELPNLSESSVLTGFTMLGLDMDFLKGIMERYPTICDNPAVEVLELLEAEP